MKQKHVDKIWERFLNASKWFFLVGFIVSSVVAVFALRHNNLRAIELRDQVLRVDQQKGDVEAALRDLREFIHSHMNANLATGTGVQQPIQLVHRYERLVAKEKARVEKANEVVYTKAQDYCERQNPTGFSGGTRVACIEEYVLENGEQPKEIPDSLYKFDFVAPRWSPDLAGWSLMASAVFMFLFLLKTGLDRWIRKEFED